MTFAEKLHALRLGVWAFSEFYVSTVGLWSYLAGRLLRSHNPGLGVDQQDVEQELVLEAWRILPKWDPVYETPIDRFVLFNTMAKAKKWLDHQREASQSAKESTHPTRAPLLGGLDTIERLVDGIGSVSWEPETEMDLARLRYEGLTNEERVVVSALLKTRNPQAAALYIYNHYPYRIQFELGCEWAATRMVRRVATRLCDDPALLNSIS